MVGLVLVAAVLASCSTTEGEADRDDARHEPTWTAGPAFPRAAPYAVVTSLDELLIAQNLSAVARFDPPDMDQQWFAARRDDGAWAALPNPPEPYESSALASIAGSVVLAGIVCDDRSECVTGRTEWSRLTDDLTEWEAIGEPAPFENRREAVVTAMPGRHEVGVFDTPAGRVSVDAGGRIGSVPSNTGGEHGRRLGLHRRHHAGRGPGPRHQPGGPGGLGCVHVRHHRDLDVRPGRHGRALDDRARTSGGGAGVGEGSVPRRRRAAAP